MKEIVEQIESYISDILRTKERVIISIDGRCGAGKSTLASVLCDEIPESSVIHMDDFFLQPYQCTEERRSEPGGNIDYERFEQEIVHSLLSKQKIEYRPFLCHSLSFGEITHIEPTIVTILEGAYSCHPKWWDCADVHVFLDIDSELQMKRIVARNGANAAENFQKLWIPFEEKYISTFDIISKCELYFKAQL